MDVLKPKAVFTGYLYLSIMKYWEPISLSINSISLLITLWNIPDRKLKMNLSRINTLTCKGLQLSLVFWKLPCFECQMNVNCYYDIFHYLNRLLMNVHVVDYPFFYSVDAKSFPQTFPSVYPLIRILFIYLLFIYLSIWICRLGGWGDKAFMVTFALKFNFLSLSSKTSYLEKCITWTY